MKKIHKKVAIVIPTHKTKHESDEELSLRCLDNKLGEIDKFIVCPDKADPRISLKNLKTIKFENFHFETWLNYNALLKTKIFWSKFIDYEFILLYQTDCLLFKANIEEWINLDYSFIGPPHINIKKEKLSFVGNGGFSLRKVKDHWEALNNKKIYLFNTKRQTLKYLLGRKRLVYFLKTIFKAFLIYIKKRINDKNYSFKESFISNSIYPEDIFWCMFGPNLNSDYKICPAKKAISFGFESAPQLAFKLNKNKKPFGCHNWTHYDKHFFQNLLNDK